MINKATINKIKEEAKVFFDKASGCHDWFHVERVCNLALEIVKKEKARKDIIEVAAYLHDIGRREEIKSKGKYCHAKEGAKLAKKILEKYKIDIKDIENICHCIEAHRFRTNNYPETIEAEIIFDADKLDSIGAIGIGRAFLFAGHSGSNCLYTGNEKELVKKAKDLEYTKEDSALLEYHFKLKNIKNKILTKTGKKIAKERNDFMVKFFNRFEKEIGGKI